MRRPRRRIEREPLDVFEAEDIAASLDRATAAVAAVHGRDRAERARLMTQLAMQTLMLQARREWREETERRLAAALALARDALAREREAEEHMMQLAALATGRRPPCAGTRRARCETAALRWFTLGARCAERCDEKG